MNHEPMKPWDHLDRLFTAFRGGGALLVVQGPDSRPNPMTIGWGTVGVIWGRPIFTVLVRPSRYTYGLIEKASTFSVNVPDGDLKEALGLCGTRSGRDLDKLAACGLTAVAGQLAGTSVIEQATYFYECRRVHRNDVIPGELDPEIVGHCYPGGDFHRLTFGEIIHAYRRV